MQTYDQGAGITSGRPNKLTVYGAIAQNFRGTGGTTSNGTIDRLPEELRVRQAVRHGCPAAVLPDAALDHVGRRTGQ